MKIKDLAIRKKFIISFSILIFMMISGGLIVGHILNKVDDYQQIKSDIAESMMLYDNTQKIEQDFLLFGWKEINFLEDGKSNYTKLFNDQIQKVESALNQTSQADIIQSNNLKNDFNAILISVNSYKNSFDGLRKLLFKRGFKDHGLEGEMRKYVHHLQSCISPEEKIFALSLRRHEKDFALRKDLNYKDKLHLTVNKFTEFISNAAITKYPHMTDTYKRNTIGAIKDYKNHFDKIVQTEIAIGLNERSGQYLQLNSNKKDIEPRIASLYQKINAQNQSLRQTATAVIFTILLLLLLTVFGLVYYLRKTVSKPIIKLDTVIKRILSGDTNIGQELRHDADDEIGSLNRNFNLMLDNLRENLRLISEKNKSLESKAKLDEVRNRNIKGMSYFSDLMKNNYDNLSEFADRMISEIVKYCKANQGALFISDEVNENPVMKLYGCYAYGKKKYIHKTIEKGEGLIGQTWIEGEPIFMTDVPQSYINITSGLGDAPPQSVMLVPLKTDKEIIGVLEIASFNIFSQHQQDFLIDLCQRIGTVIQSIKMNEKTQKYLVQSQQMTEQLQAQEEEMRQNMEELQATQEEMSRNQRSLNQAIDFKEMQINMMSSLLGKVYEGILFIDTNYSIVASNEYLFEQLKYSEKDLRGNSPELVFKTSLKKKVNALQNDPNFIVTGISERHEAKIMDKFGSIFDSRYVITEVKHKQQIFYAILFNKRDAEYGKRVLQKLFQIR